MSEMVTRVAKAMAENAGFCWENCAQSQWESDARAGIMAMRDPTVEMLIAAQEDWMCVRAAEERGDFIWRAMIDTAVSDMTKKRKSKP